MTSPAHSIGISSVREYFLQRRSSIRRLTWLFILTGLCLDGCNNAPPSEVAINSSTATVQQSHAPIPANTTPLTDSQKQEFVDRILTYVSGQSPEPQPLDAEWFVSMLRHRAGLKSGEAEEEVQTAQRVFREDNIIERWRREVEKGGNLTFLRFTTRDDRPAALFRLVQVDGSYAYHEIALAAKEHQETVAIDFYHHLQGEWQSETCFRAFVLNSPKPTSAMLLALLGKGPHTPKQLAPVVTFFYRHKDKDWKATLQHYKSLPPELQRCSLCLFMRQNAATRLPDPEAMKAGLADLKTHYPESALRYFSEIDQYSIVHQDIESLLTSIAGLEKVVGGDPFLDLYRSFVLHDVKQFARSKEFALSAVHREPSLVAAHFQVASIAQKEGDFKSVADTFRAAQKYVAIDPAVIESEPIFATFVASPEFKAWKAESEAKK